MMVWVAGDDGRCAPCDWLANTEHHLWHCTHALYCTTVHMPQVRLLLVLGWPLPLGDIMGIPLHHGRCWILILFDVTSLPNIIVVVINAIWNVLLSSYQQQQWWTMQWKYITYLWTWVDTSYSVSWTLSCTVVHMSYIRINNFFWHI